MQSVLSTTICVRLRKMKLFVCVCLSIWLGLSTAVFLEGQSCVFDTFIELNRCEGLYGFNNTASVLSASNVQLFDFTQLLAYCSDPARVNVADCMNEALSGCPSANPEDQREFQAQQTQLTSNSVDYLCSKSSTIIENMECLNQISGSITQCSRDAANNFNSNITPLLSNAGESVAFNDMREHLESMGREREECVVRLSRRECHPDVATVLGNFFYANGVYYFDVAEQTH